MKLAVAIERRGWYPRFGPIIEEALARGWEVECWHDRSLPLGSLKGYQLATCQDVPRFASGRPRVREADGPGGFWLGVQASRPDAVLSLRAPSHYRGRAGEGAPPWVVAQENGDFCQNNGAEGLLASDGVALYSDWWAGWAAHYFRALGEIDDEGQFLTRFTTKAIGTGLAALDQRRLVEPAAVRRRWGIPEGRPVVVLLPFDGAINPFSFWARHIYLQPNPLLQIGRMAHAGRIDYWRDVVHRWHDARMVRAIRRFCDRSGAYLLVKARKKTPVPPYLAAAADRCVFDESLYPATIIEALSIADLCVSFFSAAVMEAIGLGVPHLTLGFPAERYYDGAAEDWANSLVRFRQFYASEEGSVFRFAGAAWLVAIPEAIEGLGGMSLDAFRLRPDAQRAYVARYLGSDDGRSAERVVDLLGRVAAGEPAVSRAREAAVG